MMSGPNIQHSVCKCVCVCKSSLHTHTHTFIPVADVFFFCNHHCLRAAFLHLSMCKGRVCPNFHPNYSPCIFSTSLVCKGLQGYRLDMVYGLYMVFLIQSFLVLMAPQSCFTLQSIHTHSFSHPCAAHFSVTDLSDPFTWHRREQLGVKCLAQWHIGM